MHRKLCTDGYLKKCLTNFCSQNTFINQNSDVFMGFVGWGAGSFDTSYILSLTPSKQNNAFVDNQLMQQCVLDIWNSVVATTPTSPASPSGGSISYSTFYSTPVVLTTVPPASSNSDNGGSTTGAPLETSTVTPETDITGGLLTATTAPGGAALPTGAPTTMVTGGAGGLLTASGGGAAPNATATATATASGGNGVVTASGAQATKQLGSWFGLLGLGVVGVWLSW